MENGCSLKISGKWQSTVARRMIEFTKNDLSRPTPREPKRPRMSRLTPRAPTHASQPFSVFTQSFGASVSHVLVSLSHLVIVNSTIFWYSELSHFSYSKLSHFSYRAQSFYDFISHSARELIHSFLLQYLAILATVFSHFCYIS
jgi:hypothetical protein